MPDSSVARLRALILAAALIVLGLVAARAAPDAASQDARAPLATTYVAYDGINI